VISACDIFISHPFVVKLRRLTTLTGKPPATVPPTKFLGCTLSADDELVNHSFSHRIISFHYNEITLCTLCFRIDFYSFIRFLSEACLNSRWIYTGVTIELWRCDSMARPLHDATFTPLRTLVKRRPTNRPENFRSISSHRRCNQV
jgi:hypothetical protein